MDRLFLNKHFILRLAGRMIWLVLLLLIVPEWASGQVSVTYVANEGILISGGSQKVIIDGLHRKYKPAYAYLPDPLRIEAEMGKGPFSNLDLILVTHQHGDHFHPESVGTHLLNNPDTRLIAPPQVVTVLQDSFSKFDEISHRVRSILPPENGKEEISENGIALTVFRIPHSNPFTEMHNLGYLVEIGGQKLLHVGDARMDYELFSQFELKSREISIATLPYWFLLSDSGQEIIDELIVHEQLVALHISPVKDMTTCIQIQDQYPQALAFIRMMKTYIKNFPESPVTQSTTERVVPTCY